MRRYSKAWWLHVCYFVAEYIYATGLAMLIVFLMILVLAAVDGAVDWP